ncbi:TorF family putative porin [Methylophaga sp.]|uniref:TorF family putative porin n=1 Tax=Methylophaga sp. TaxID=2024840 RepID=UPI0025E8457B|nr:TorF family putative porin [Methylophaga sp.]
MKFKTLSAMCLAATSVFAASSAMAWESEDGSHSTSANVGLFSDYMFRGISLTDNKPAIQGGFDYAHSSGLYAGTWASNLSIDSETNIEIDVYGGFASEFGESGIGYDVGLLRYIYPGTNSGEDIDYTEYYGGLSYSYFSAMIFYTDDFGNGGEDEIYYKLGFDYDLPYGLALSAHYGYTDSDRNTGTDLSDSYSDYSIGLTKGFAGLDWSVAYVGTDSDGDDFAFGNDEADDRFVVSVGASF